MATSPALTTIIEALRSRPAPPDITFEQRRADMEAMQAALTIPDDVVCEPADADGVPLEFVRTPGVDGDRVLFYLHGGGYAIGSLDTHRYLLQELARSTRATVLGVEYRLAPENPFPAAVDDSITAWRWLLRRGIDPQRCAMGGDSAGGGLTLATLLKIRHEGGSLPAAAVCLSPWTDLASAIEATETKNDDPLVTDSALRQMANAYIGDGDASNPLISPILADLADLPPLLIQVGTKEHLLDDATGFAERARAAGVDVSLEEWEDMIHVFQFFPSLRESGQAIERIGEFVRAHTGGRQ